MSDLVPQAIGAAIFAARETLEKATRWPDLGAALAKALLADASQPLPPGFGEIPAQIGPALLRRSPELACLGYELHRIVEPAVHQAWINGFSRLMSRETYPADRDSFVHEPLELVGLTWGLMACTAASREHLNWLVTELETGLTQKRIAMGISEISVRFALYLIEEAASPVVHSLDMSGMSVEHLSILFGFSRLAPGWAGIPLVNLQNELTRRALGGANHHLTPIEAAAFVIILDQIIDRLTLTDPSIDAFDAILRLCRRLPLMIQALQGRQQNKADFEVRDEYDVQDLLHGLLRLHFNDVRPEEYTPSYAGKSSRIDFLLPRERIMIEAKMTRQSLKGKEVADQLIVDKERYRKQPGVDSLICIVYDPGGYCANPTGIENDLSETGAQLRTAVIVTPQGM